VTFRSILCPVDFSPQSRTALEHAVAMARRFASRLAVVYVNDPLLLAAAKTAYRGQRHFVDQTRAELARFVKPVASVWRERHEHVALVVSAGNPAEEILSQVRQRRSDLVVMGSHGLSGIQKVFFGSTTEQVLRQASAPVLAVPPATRKAGGRGIEFARVIAPIDLAGEWQSDAVRAATIANEFNARLLLVHVLAPVQAPPWARAAARANERRRIEKATAALERVRTKLFARLQPITSHVVVGNPADAIVRLANSRGSLVVMSLRGTAGVWGMRRGAIAYRVLTHSSTPVLALPRRRIGGRFLVRARSAVNEMLTARDRTEMAGIDALLSVGAGRTPLKR